MREIMPIALLIYLAEVVLLLPRIPLWLFIVCMLGLCWKALSLRLGIKHPPRVLLLILGIMILSLALIDTPRFWHKETATAAILIVALLFLLDRPRPRQLMLTHSSFFGALVALLVTTGTYLPLFIYFGLTFLIFISLMLHHLPSKVTISPYALSRKLLKTALPIATFILPIYFLFPDLKPNPADRAVTGLSDSIEPGKFAALARSERVAFRVRFHEPEKLIQGEVLKKNPLYWRVAVLEESFGMSWRRGPVRSEDPFRLARSSTEVVYEIMTEPRLGSALPLLEQTAFAFPLRKTETGIFWNASQRSFHSAHSILEVGSRLDTAFVPADPPDPPSPSFETSPRVQGLARELAALPLDAQIAQLLELFKSFSYTLEPGTLDSDDPLDQFLFEKKTGYCEHFAASFASLMQMAGNPARVVSGFSGGSALGESGFYLLVDGDAHAWTEVWTGKSWQRVDPSAVVPGRVLGADSVRKWSAIPIAWLDYGSRQLGIKLRNLMQDIEMVWLLVFSLGGLLLVLQVLRIWRRTKIEAVWQRELNRLLKRLEQKGFSQEPSETMARYLVRASQELPRQRDGLLLLKDSYDQLLFGPRKQYQDEVAFKKALRDLHKTFRN